MERIASILLLITLFTSCKKDNVPDEIDKIEGITCTIDGESFVVNGSTNFITTGWYNTGGDNTYFFNGSDDSDRSLDFQFGQEVLAKGTYTIGGQITAIYNDGDFFYYDIDSSGTFTVDAIDDEVMSGTFNFDLRSTGSTVLKVADGKFFHIPIPE